MAQMHWNGQQLEWIETNEKTPQKQPKEKRVKRLSKAEQDWERKAEREAFRVQPAESIETQFRHAGWKERRALVLAAMRRVNVPDSRIERFVHCGSGCQILHSPSTGRTKVAGNYCHDRWCLPCASARAARIMRKLTAKLAGQRFHFVTLTLKHSSEPLSQQISRLLRHFKALRNTKGWKARVHGGAFTLELKRNAAGTEWHPHLHILHTGKLYDGRLLSVAWKKITGDSFICDSRTITNQQEGIRYVAKYASKPFDGSILREAEALDECITALRGRRLCGAFGDWRGWELEGEIEDAGDWQSLGTVRKLWWEANNGNLAAAAVLVPFVPSELRDHLLMLWPVLGAAGNLGET